MSEAQQIVSGSKGTDQAAPLENCNPLQIRPRRNRVSPCGAIEQTPHRGGLMGNRGDLHAPDGTLNKPWQIKRWIACTLHSATGHKVSFDLPGRYYPLFFTDEAVALAAGHRPCAQCRRADYDRFAATWMRAHSKDRKWKAAEIDGELHRSRLLSNGQKATYTAPAASLPSGCFVLRKQGPAQPLLYWLGRLFVWRHSGYVPGPFLEDLQEEVTVLTPRATVETIRAGYEPQVAVV